MIQGLAAAAAGLLFAMGLKMFGRRAECSAVKAFAAWCRGNRSGQGFVQRSPCDIGACTVNS